MFFSNSWSPKNGETLILVLVLTCFSQTPQTRASPKNWENWLVLVLTDWNLEPSAYTRIEGKIWKCKVAPKNNVFFQKGLNRHAYTHTHIYIFLNSWNPKNGKIAYFLVLTCFFSNSWKSKKLEKKWLVLVLTDWNLEPSAYTRIEGKIWKCKVAPKNNVFFQKGLNRHAYTHTYIYIYFSTPGIQKMGKLPNFWCWHVFLKLLESKKWGKLIIFCWHVFSQPPEIQKMGKLLVLVLTCFFSNSWSPKNGENWLVLVLTCFFLKLLVLTCFSQTRASQKMGNID